MASYRCTKKYISKVLGILFYWLEWLREYLHIYLYICFVKKNRTFRILRSIKLWALLSFCFYTLHRPVQSSSTHAMVVVVSHCHRMTQNHRRNTHLYLKTFSGLGCQIFYILLFFYLTFFFNYMYFREILKSKNEKKKNLNQTWVTWSVSFKCIYWNNLSRYTLYIRWRPEGLSTVEVNTSTHSSYSSYHQSY